ncbi:MAG: N-acetyltransferase [Clostridiales Family XIII bacterium]|nr:N-acetyltransferase [Clostridiales Family XIII bacterium]
MNFKIVNIIDLYEELGEDQVTQFLSSFYCPHNTDIEEFLKSKAIGFSRQGIAATYIVIARDGSDNIIVGYFSLANKVILVDPVTAKNSDWRRRFSKFGKFQEETSSYLLAVPLIGQLGRNFADKADNLIRGNELISYAEEKIRVTQRIIGGKMVYIECADEKSLVSFYEKNGYHIINHRKSAEGDLLQMIKYLK